jgi:hypothetical protein
VAPAKSTITCGAAHPTFILSGSITTNQAGTVTYHWALSNGTNGATRTLTFGAAGTEPVVPHSFTPPTDTFAGSGKIVVTSPVAATSNAAHFTLSCSGPMSHVTGVTVSESDFTLGPGGPPFIYTFTYLVTVTTTGPGPVTLGCTATEVGGNNTPSCALPSTTVSGQTTYNFSATGTFPNDWQCTVGVPTGDTFGFSVTATGTDAALMTGSDTPPFFCGEV